MKALAVSLVGRANELIVFYYGFVNLVYTALLLVATVSVRRHIRRIRYSPFRDLGASPETPPVSFLVPAHNEEQVIVRTVRSTLAVNYPYFEVVVVNDGSTDGTLETLVRTFRLRRIDRAYRDVLKTGPVRGFYYNPDVPNLLVVDKGHSGKADSLNCGINVSRSPYFCTVDADSILEEDALIKLMTPVVESTVPVVACGGVVRALNGVRMEDGAARTIDLPRSALAMFQIVEYLRAFLFGRVGLDALNGILILPGAFSLFRKASVVEVEGYRPRNVTEDMELVTRLHRHAIERKEPYAVRFISDPVCWTEVPESIRMLARQRRRWHLGLVQTLVQNRSALFRPRYGRFGWVVLPYFLLVELLSPVVETAGYAVVLLSWMWGLLSVHFLLLFLAMAVFYGIFLSTASVYLEEISYRRYPRWSHMLRLLFYGVVENFGYRQVNSFWRCQAILRYLVGMRKWEHVEKGNLPPEEGRP